jgi:uncharacterized RDD family membrane protein YckC
MKTKLHSGLFRRFIAYTIDGIISLIVGVAITYPFTSYFYQHDSLEPISAFVISLLYFTVMDSNLVRFQSPGKSIMGIKLVTINNDKLEVKKSFLRTLFVIFPLMNRSLGVFLTAEIFGNESILLFSHYSFFMLIALTGSGISIFPLFHSQNRGVHDILFSTTMLQAPTKEFSPKNWSSIPTTLALLCIIATAFGLSKVPSLVKKQEITFNEIDNISKILREKLQNDKIQTTYKTFSVFSDGKESKTKSVVVNITLYPEQFEDKEKICDIENNLYSLILENSKSFEADKISINYTLKTYYGIFAFNRKHFNSIKVEDIKKEAIINEMQF